MNFRLGARIAILTIFSFVLPVDQLAVAQSDGDREKVFQPETASSLALLEAQVSEPEVGEPAEDKEQEKQKDQKKTYRADLGKDLLPGSGTLFGRAMTFTFAYQDQADKIVSATGLAPNQTLQVQPNPESRLRQLGITLSPQQWFRSAADFKAAYDTAGGKTTKKYIDASGTKDPLECLASGYLGEDPSKCVADVGDKLDFLAWTGKDRLVRRVALGLSMEVAVNDRTRDPGDPAFPDSGRDTTWNFKFDPDALTVFPGDLAAAYAALKAHTGLAVGNLARLYHPTRSEGDQQKKVDCDENSENPIKCLNTLTGRNVKGRWLAALIPTFEYKRLSQFEFQSLNGAFVSSPDIEGTLDTYTVTWDLGATLNTAKHRRDAITAISIHKELMLQDKMRTEKKLIIEGSDPAPIKVGEVLYQPFIALQKDKKSGEEKRAQEITWSAHLGSGKEGPPLKDLKLTLTSDGTLVGKPDATADGKMVTIRATDKYKKSAALKVKLSVS